VSVDEIIKRFNLDQSVIEAWARAKYPKFWKNTRLMVAAYLNQVMGMNVDPFSLGMVGIEDVTPVAELEAGQWCNIEVLIAAKAGEVSYTACPECYKAISEENACEEHGSVTPIVAVWDKFVVGDISGDVVASFSPREKIEASIVGQTITAQGSYNQARGEFTVRRYSLSTEELLEEPIGEGEPPPVPTPDALAKEEAEVQKAMAAVDSVEEEKTTAELSTEELQKFKQFVYVYDGVPIEQLQRWHQSKGLKTPIDALIEAAGLVLRDDRYYLEEL